MTAVTIPMLLSPNQNHADNISCQVWTLSSATSTPTHPYSSTELIGSYTEPQSARLLTADDGRLSNGGFLPDTGRNSKEKQYKETGVGPQFNNTPCPLKSIAKEKNQLVINSKEKGVTDREKDNRDRHKDGSLPTTHKNNYFKPTGTRHSNIFGAQPISPSQRQQILSPTLSREQEDGLIAMGTNWHPSSIPNICNSQTNYTRAGAIPNNRPGSQNTLNGSLSSSHSNGGYISLAVSQAPMNSAPRRKTTMPQISGSRSYFKEGEPRYPDPLAGTAPPTFQQRLAELASLENETIRWERTRKFKKKSKPDSNAKET